MFTRFVMSAARERRRKSLSAILVPTLGTVLLAVTLSANPAAAATPGDPVFGAPTTTGRLGGGGGSPAAPVNCPAGSVLTSVTAHVAVDPDPRVNWLTGADASCAPIVVGAGVVSVGSASPAGSIQGFRSNTSPADSVCPAGSFATGLQGHGGGLTDGVELLCSPLVGDGSFSPATESGGYAGGPGGSPQGPFSCPVGAVATGLAGNAGEDLDSIGLICESLTYAAYVPPQPDNSAWPNAQLVGGNSTTDATINTSGQELWYKFPVVPESRVQVDLTGLGADYNLALFKDIGQAYTTLTSTSDLTHLSAEFAGDAFSPSAFSPSAFSPSAFSPSAFSPSAFSPSAFSPSAFSPSAFSPSAFSPSAFSPAVSLPSAFSPSAFSPSAFSPSTFTAAFASAQTRSLIGVSAHDSTTSESISAATWNNTGYFYVRVQGRNGALSADAFHLTVTTSGGPCSGLTLADHATDSTLVGAPGPQTIILTDPTRLNGSAAGKATLASTLATFATKVNGVVVDVSQSPKVAALNRQADGAAVSCPYAKNLVAQAIRDIVNTYRGDGSTLKYVVLVGDDHVIPFFRYADGANIGPESGYVPPVSDNSASQASLRSNDVLSQDAYGAQTDVSIKGTTMPIPDLAVGRLVETPAEITGTVQNYLDLNGAPITPSSTLATGYDFLAGGAQQVASDFAAGTPGGTHDTLITNQGVSPTTTTVGGVPSPTTSWTAADLSKQLLGARHDLVYLAGHFSANSALSADYSTSVLTTDLANAPAANFKNTVVFSAGCHSGYNIVDTDGIPGVTVGLDWTQAFAQKGATLIAGTGYQYGDTDFVKYSVQLYADFAHQLRLGQGAVPVGSALVQAKQQYLAGSPVLQGIDQKALLESTLYGLPMLGVDLPGGRITPPSDPSQVTPAAVTSDPGSTLGLQVAPLDLTPSLTTNTKVLTSTDGGSVTTTYLSGANGTDSGPSSPTLPLINANVTAPNGQVLRGVGFRSGSYTDTDGITPLTGAPATESSGAHAAFVSSAFYPNRLASPNYFDALSGGGTTRLMVTPAQYMSDAPGSLTDTQRQYSALGLRLYYSSNIQTYADNTPALAAPPSISGVSATPSTGGTRVTLQAHVVGDPSAGIQQVWITYTGVRNSPFHGSWASIDLTQDAHDSTLWTATLNLPDGQNSGDVRYLVQAVNGVGLVGADDNQGTFYRPGITPGVTTPSLTTTSLIQGSGTPTSGAYGRSIPVSATLQAEDGSAVSGRLITFDLGGTSATASTDASGVATATLPLNALPGSYNLTASFDGDATYASAASAPAPFSIGKQGTSLTIVPGSGAGNGVTATLKADGSAVPEKTVFIVATNAADGSVASAIAKITDGLGTVTVPASALPPGDVKITAVFGSAQTPLPNGATADLSDSVYGPASAGTLRTATIISTSLPPATLNDAYSAPIVVAGSPGPTLTASGLPTGIALTHAGGVWSLAGTAGKVGVYPVQITADNGVSAPASVTLRLVVGYRVVGFLQPVNDPPGATPSVFNARSTVPIIFRLTDGQGTPIPLKDALAIMLGGRATIKITQAGTTTQKVNEPVTILPMQPGKNFLYDPIGQHFFYLASAANSGFVAGRTYTVTATITSPAGDVIDQHSVVIGVNK
ncbi:MAG: large repetitive protein [Pseudonocardiales bacterium]|nr:large repetitive protein [Pseudonocardiales bacterium]